MSWQWKMMQNLKRNWLVCSKLTWGIWRSLTGALENLKNLHFNELLLNKLYNAWAKKSIGELCLVALNIDVTFDGKLTCLFKNDTRNLVNFHQSMFESLKIGTLRGSFYTEEELTCQFQMDMRNLTNFDPGTQKLQKFAL